MDRSGGDQGDAGDPHNDEDHKENSGGDHNENYEEDYEHEDIEDFEGLPSQEDDFLKGFKGDPHTSSLDAGLRLALQFIDALKNVSLNNRDLDAATLERLAHPPQHPLEDNLATRQWRDC